MNSKAVFWTCMLFLVLSLTNGQLTFTHGWGGKRSAFNPFRQGALSCNAKYQSEVAAIYQKIQIIDNMLATVIQQDNRSCAKDAVWPTSCYTAADTALTVLPVVLIITVIVIGNGLVVLAVMRDKKLKSMRQNWLVVSLSFADFFVGLLIMPLTLIYEILGEWPFGSSICDLWLSLDILFVTASILNLCAISLDRYWAVTNPVHYPALRTGVRMGVMVFCPWVGALMISLPLFVGWQGAKMPGQCLLSTELGFVLYSAIGSFWIPVMVVTVVYARIFVIVRGRIRLKMKEVETKQATLVSVNVSRMDDTPEQTPLVVPKFRGRNKSKNHKKQQNATNDDEGPIIRESSNLLEVIDPQRTKPRSLPILKTGKKRKKSSRQSFRQEDVKQEDQSCMSSTRDLSKFYKMKKRRQKRKNRQATMVLGVVLVAFLVCWMPFFTLYVLGAFGIGAPELVFDIFFWIGYCNSALNPVIYTVCNPDFRAAFKKILFS